MATSPNTFKNSIYAGPRRGFTLIELLVVVAILALLIAILLPSLGRARNRAKAAACLSNVRQMGMAYQFYVNDAALGKNIAQNTGQAGAFWMYQIQPYLQANNLRDVKLKGGRTVSGNVFFCPFANLIPSNEQNTAPGAGSTF